MSLLQRCANRFAVALAPLCQNSSLIRSWKFAPSRLFFSFAKLAKTEVARPWQRHTAVRLLSSDIEHGAVFEGLVRGGHATMVPSDVDLKPYAGLDASKLSSEEKERLVIMATDALKKHMFEKTRAISEPLALAKHAAAQCLYGRSIAMIAMQRVLKQQPPDGRELLKARAWLQRSVDNGYHPACEHLALLLLATGEKAQAEIYLRKGGDAGSSRCFQILGTLCAGEPNRVNEALSYLHRAYKRGSMEALVQIGLIYESGMGEIAADLMKALSVFRQAAETGDRDGQYHLGRVLLTHTKGHLAEARQHLEGAAEKGSVDSRIALADAHLRGLFGAESSVSAAIGWVQDIAKQGANPEAMYLLAIALAKIGKFVEAVEHLQRAMKMGHVKSMVFLADLHGSGGAGSAQSKAEAYRLYANALNAAKAEEEDESTADQIATRVEIHQKMAAILEAGTGVKQDLRAALGHYKQALQLGDKSAMRHVSRLSDLLQSNTLSS